jgi:hypothetical protein
MKQVPLSELSQDELLKKAKALKAASANQGAMLVILAVQFNLHVCENLQHLQPFL